MREYVCELPVGGMVFARSNRKIPVHEKVVRCRDCKHMFDDGFGYPYCGRRPGNCFEVTGDGFCKWGERRAES